MNFKFSRIMKNDRMITSSITYSADGRLIGASVVIVPRADKGATEEKTA